LIFSKGLIFSKALIFSEALLFSKALNFSGIGPAHFDEGYTLPFAGLFPLWLVS
jgi:hypothetical protein